MQEMKKPNMEKEKGNEGSVQSTGVDDQTEKESANKVEEDVQIDVDGSEIEGNADLGQQNEDVLESKIKGNAVDLGVKENDKESDELVGMHGSKESLIKRTKSMEPNKTRRMDDGSKFRGRGSSSTDGGVKQSAMADNESEIGSADDCDDLGSDDQNKENQEVDTVAGTGVEEEQTGEGNQENNPTLQQNRAVDEEMDQSSLLEQLTKDMEDERQLIEVYRRRLNEGIDETEGKEMLQQLIAQLINNLQHEQIILQMMSLSLDTTTTTSTTSAAVGGADNDDNDYDGDKN